MEEELESGNSLIESTSRGFERNRGSKRNNRCSIFGIITSTLLITVLGTGFSAMVYEKYSPAAVLLGN